MRVLVCGGRHYYNKQLVKKTLDQLHAAKPISCIIHGGVSGADFLARHWSIAYGQVPHEEYKADWGNGRFGQGRSAGPKRNAIMLKEGKPDLVVAFPGGKGTADMVRKARKAGVAIMEIEDAKID